MPHKDIDSLSNSAKIGFILIGLATGIYHFGSSNLKDISFWKKVFIFLYDCTVAGSLSTLSGLIVLAYTGNEAYALGIGGIIGYLGNRFLKIIEQALKNKLGVK